MKYNPRDQRGNGRAAWLYGRPSAGRPPTRCRAAVDVLELAQQYLCEITGMDGMTFQPAAGAHGEFTGVLLIKAVS